MEAEDYYDISHAFIWLANLSGLTVDLINFLLCQILALFLASFFRTFLHPTKVSTELRHIFCLILGLLFGYFCFGKQAIHIAGLPAICYIVIRTQDPHIVQRSVMVVALSYLSCIHLHRLIYDYGSYSLDITGPLMIITQKVTSLAFSIHDGFTREEKNLTKTQQYHAIKTVPSVLEYFSYVLHFQGLLAGPVVFYKDYIDFIEGYHVLKHAPTQNNIDSKLGAQIVLEPSPTKAVIEKVIGSLICAFIFMKFIRAYPIRALKDDNLIKDWSIYKKMYYLILSTTVIRFKYYHAWLLADAICNNSGLGFNGYDQNGNSKWDLISNIKIISFELSTNFRNCINQWNIGTNYWLRMVVYERVNKKYGTVLTFALSALWHGFYPGYYLTFATGALFVTSARYARKMFRHRFQRAQHIRIFYDIITCLVTRIFMGYATFPFVLLEFKTSLVVYLNLYLCLHLVAIFGIVALPKFIKEQNMSKNSFKTNQNIIKTNNCDNKKLYDNSHESSNVLLEVKPNANIIPSVIHNAFEMDNFSNKIKEKIEFEAKNIEVFFDKTFTGFVGFKDDLMRMNEDESKNNQTDFLLKKRLSNDKKDTVDTFIKKEIDALNAAVHQANVLPAVLSNGHAK